MVEECVPSCDSSDRTKTSWFYRKKQNGRHRLPVTASSPALCLFYAVFFACLFQPFTARAQQARFDEANSLLEQNEYRSAADLYQSIADEGYQSGALWFNMGVAYSQLDSLGVSKFYFLRAEQFPETRRQARDALSYINQNFPRRSPVLPALPWDRFFEFLSLHAGTVNLYYAAFAALYIGITLIIISWFKRRPHKVLRRISYTAVFTAVLLFSCALYIHYLDHRFGTGVMTDRETAVYEQPGTDAPVISTAYEGYSMRVDFYRSEEYPGWRYIRLENGMHGWIEREALLVF